MMCDNLSLYKSFAPSTTAPPPPHLPEHADDNEHRPSAGTKRKLSDYEDIGASKTAVESDESDDEDVDNEDEDDDDDEDEDDNDDEASSDDDEAMSDDDLRPATTRASMLASSPSTIIHRRHSDTIQPTYGTPIVKRRCTYSSMHDDEQKRSMLVESYRKLRGVKKPKLQVSLLICNLIKRLEKTFSKSPPLPHDEHEQDPVQYYQPARTAYRSSSSDSLYMSPLSSTLVNDELESTHQQYSPAHVPAYDSDKVLLSGGELRTSPSMYHTSTTDAYWLAQSNFAVPVVSTSDEDDADVSLHGGGDYLDLSDHTLSSSFSSAGSPSSSGAGDCCCSSTSSSTTTTTTTTTKHLVDTNNNMSGNDDYFIYHHQHETSNGQAFFYSHNGTNTVDIITTA